MRRFSILNVVIGLCCLTITHTKKIDEPVSVRCINCLCHAATGCDSKNQCRGELCGPFNISKNQWLEANSPTVNRQDPSNTQAFQECANSFYCAYFVIQRYFQKYQKDCNGDGKIDCDDFVAIHKLGFANCSDELPENYFGRYDYCQSVVSE